MTSIPFVIAQFAVPKPVVPIWPGFWILSSIVAVLVVLLIWMLWRMRSLVRVVQQLQSGEGKPVTLPGTFGFLPRFKMRTLLVMFTVAAILLGLFAKEFSRARRQGQIVEQLEMTDAFDSFGSSYYRLGMLGDSYLAGVICDWVHPHFGCRLTHLSLDMETSFYSQSHPVESSVLKHFDGLRDLEVLRIANAQLLEEHIEAIAELPKLKMLSLAGCSLPAETVEILSKLDRLEHLDLTGCNLNDSELAGLSKFTELTSLTLANNRLTDESIDQVEKLTKLQTLSLAGNDITRVGVIGLLRLDQLTDLNLAVTKIDTEGACYLVELPKLRWLNMALCANIPAREEADVADVLLENRKIDIEWAEPKDESEEWEFYDNRPTGLDFSRGGGLGNVPYPSGGGGGAF